MFQAEVVTPHPCSVTQQTECSGDECSSNTDNRHDSACDKEGCDLNSYRMGNTTFLGEGMTGDTTQTITVFTQFITSDNTTSGEMRSAASTSRTATSSRSRAQPTPTSLSTTPSPMTSALPKSRSSATLMTSQPRAVLLRWRRLRGRYGPCPLPLGRLRSQHALARLRLPHDL